MSDEAFAVCRRNSSVILEAHTELGLMMGAGRLLREIAATPNGSAVLPATLRLRVSPPPWASMRGQASCRSERARTRGGASKTSCCTLTE